MACIFALLLRKSGRLIYEWDQTIEEVNIYIDPPAGVTKDVLEIVIQPKRVSVGVKSTPPYINVCSFHLFSPSSGRTVRPSQS
jgi:hypothetical protein